MASPPVKQVQCGYLMLMATGLQRGQSIAVVMMVQGAAVGPVFARRRCRTGPLLAIASAVAQAHWRRHPQNKSRANSSCLRQPACNRAKARRSLCGTRAAVSPVFARRRCRTEPASSYSERRSSSPLAPPPAKQVPGGFSMLTATCRQPGKSTAVVMVV